MSEVLAIHQAKITSNRLERRSMDGREYAVAPVVAVVEGVLNGLLAPREEIGAYVDAWNGRPVPVRHPQRDGEYISANSPDVVEQVVIGQFYNAQFDTDRLKGELWIDVAKVSTLGGDALAVLERLENGQPVEVSTAYYCDVQETSGYHKGKFYEGVQRNMRPDHIALLPDEIGACSWAAGCGAPRVNQEGGLMANSQTLALTTNQNHDGVMVAFFLSQADAGQYALRADDLPEGSQALPVGELHVTLAYLGTIEEVAMVVDEGTLLSNLADFARYEVLVSGQISGIGRFNAAEGEPEPIWLSVDAPSLVEFRWRLLEWIGWCAPVSRLHGFYPHITLAYVPAGAAVPLSPPAPQGIAFDSVALAWGNRVTMFRLQGEQRMLDVNQVQEEQMMSDKEKNRVEPKPKTDAQVQTPTASSEGGEGSQVQANAQQPALAAQAEAPALPAEVTELVGLVRELGGVAPLRSAIQAVQVNASRMREELVGRLVANRGCAFPKERLEAMALEDLEMLDRSLRPADYSGRNGMASNVFAEDGDWEEYQAPEQAAQQ